MADEPEPASMTQDAFGAAHPGFYTTRDMSHARTALRHIACSPSVGTGDAMLASVISMEDTTPQFAHVCKGGTTERAGP